MPSQEFDFCGSIVRCSREKGNSFWLRYSIIEENFGIEEPGAFRVEALCKPKDKRDDLPLVTVWGWR